MTFLAILLTAILVLIVAKRRFLSFRSQAPTDYTGTGPAFKMKEHLNGEILSEGLIYGPNGKMSNSFVARMVGEWDGNTGTLAEYFTYSNGKQMTRKWYLTLGTGNTFTATADDIVGEGQGTISGSTVKLTYRIILPEDAGGHTLDVTDWMYLTENGVIMNRSEMRKFGLKVAELVATMRPAPEAKPAHVSGSNGYDATAETRTLQ
jgi:antitoxin component YwqK of YwqJK toxin-antitoxin module